jgi:hypothetical protein
MTTEHLLRQRGHPAGQQRPSSDYSIEHPIIQRYIDADIDYSAQAFENTSTNVAASQMRNALNNLIDTVKEPSEKKV